MNAQEVAWFSTTPSVANPFRSSSLLATHARLNRPAPQVIDQLASLVQVFHVLMAALSARGLGQRALADEEHVVHVDAECGEDVAANVARHVSAGSIGRRLHFGDDDDALRAFDGVVHAECGEASRTQALDAEQ